MAWWMEQTRTRSASVSDSEMNDTERYPTVYEGRDGRIFRNNDALPRFFAPDIVILEFKGDNYTHKLAAQKDFSNTAIVKKLPILNKPNLTIEGNGATMDGSGMKEGSAVLDIRTNDVIVRDLRLRNGDDNLRVDGPEAYRVVVTHVSSTGAGDDGVSIGYGAHDVTLQYSFVAGNTRSVYCKYPGTNRISLHHTWIQKGAIREPLFSGHLVADMRNVIVEDWLNRHYTEVARHGAYRVLVAGL